MDNILLTEMEAYLCMINFLDELYKKSHSDTLALFLGSMEINLYDNKPMDYAMWEDWLDAIKKFKQDATD